MSAPAIDSEIEVREDADVDRPWITIVWDDPINLMNYVTHVFMQVFGYPKSKAHRLMLDVHTKGRAVVSSGSRERMEFDVSQLHGYGLWATVSHDLVRVTRRRGVVRVSLDEVEIGLLRSLFDDLADALRGMGDDDPVRRRMFPAGYRDDPEAAGEYRELTESALLEQRQSRIAQALAELPPAAGEITLDADAATRWLTVLNDLRLAIGTRIGIDADTSLEDQLGDDDLTGDAGPDDTPDVAADRAARAVYVWLTALLDRLVEAVTD